VVVGTAPDLAGATAYPGENYLDMEMGVPKLVVKMYMNFDNVPGPSAPV